MLIGYFDRGRYRFLFERGWRNICKALTRVFSIDGTEFSIYGCVSVNSDHRWMRVKRRAGVEV